MAAHELRKQLPRPHRVVLIERSTTHLFSPSLLWLMIGQRQPQAISRPLETLAQKGIEVIRERSPRCIQKPAPFRSMDRG